MTIHFEIYDLLKAKLRQNVEPVLRDDESAIFLENLMHESEVWKTAKGSKQSGSKDPDPNKDLPKHMWISEFPKQFIK